MAQVPPGVAHISFNSRLPWEIREKLRDKRIREVHLSLRTVVSVITGHPYGPCREHNVYKEAGGLGPPSAVRHGQPENSGK